MCRPSSITRYFPRFGANSRKSQNIVTTVCLSYCLRADILRFSRSLDCTNLSGRRGGFAVNIRQTSTKSRNDSVHDRLAKVSTTANLRLIPHTIDNDSPIACVLPSSFVGGALRLTRPYTATATVVASAQLGRSIIVRRSRHLQNRQMPCPPPVGTI